MKLVLPRTPFGALARLVAAAALVAIIAVGAPLHSHDIVADGGPLKAPCAACVSSATPGLVLDRADFIPALEAVDAVSVTETFVVALPLPVRSGRAPPAV